MVRPQPHSSGIDGSWVGRWQNNVKQGGDDSLVLKTDDRELLTGTWSGNLSVTVQRLGNQLVLLEAHEGDKTYRGAGRLEGQRLMLEYRAQANDEDYQGWAVFQQTGNVASITREAHADFAGSWSGTFENSAGGAGDDTLELAETDDGTLSGKWSGLAVTGERLGNASFYLTARRGDLSYRLVGHVQKGQLTLGYSATSKKTHYTGQAVLTSSE